MGHIFISYSHKDTNYAHALTSALQGRGFEAWIDERLDYGSQWPHEIQKQLDSCSAFIVVMSPHAFASEWVQSELQRAKRKQKPIFPLLLEGDEPWLSVESTQFFDVRGGTFPDERFFAALGRVLVVTPSQPPKAVEPVRKRGAAVPLSRTGIILGVVALLAVGAAALWMFLSSPNRSATPAENGSVLAPATDYTDDHGVEMKLIPAGDFLMGTDPQAALEECLKFDPSCQLDWFTDEAPQRNIYLDSYYIDLYEVTNKMYRACVDAKECLEPFRTGSSTRADYFYNADFDYYPVIYVDWDMAQNYCAWRGAQLPSEAQWEKAARGMDGRLYPWGNEIEPSFANYAASGLEDTSAVGDYGDGASPYGVLDMAGNVWEWVNDWYNDSYYRLAPLSNPPGPDSGEFHVLRGGSWADVGYVLHASLRGRDDPTVVQDRGYGFRCVRPMP